MSPKAFKSVEAVKSLEEEEVQNLTRAIELVEEKKGYNLALLDMRETSLPTSFFLLVDGDNPKQVKAIAENVIGEWDRELYGKEGLGNNSWVVLDYGDLLIHVFQEDVRTFYDLDGLWSDCLLPIEDLS